MLRYFSTFSFLLTAVLVFAQQPAIVPGQLIILLQDNTSFQQFLAEYRSTGRSAGIHYHRQLSASVPVYLIESEAFDGNEREALSQIKNLSTVRLAQVNHIVNQRNMVPGDPRYNEQWQWQNNGQGGGLEGADVDAEKAWDITTGGLTASGDTIVVCIVDDGTDLDHEDLAANIWYNKGEIPGNGIDDDGNGFVDDVNGWNFNAQSNNVNQGSHGVNVNGMIGAVGNNNTGITGINWNVRMMNVVYAGLSEDAVITSYDYPLQSRILYNNTNGEKGAFVVAVNSSWGIDYGKPEDAPIWCNFYDIMGEAGIINVAATSNSEINVDVDGDLPTGCSSPYLISVGRTSKTDEYARCGYGVETIDLGAPGVNIVTTRSNDRYTTTTGTSFASPLVAGMVALMYSYPCEGVANLIHQNYAAFALGVKNAILQGVDVIPSYADRCLTGGRANAFNSLEIMGLLCAACQPGSVTSFTYKEDNTYILTFSNGEIQTNLRYRISGTADWTEITDVESPYELVLPSACTDYDFQLQTICPDDTSAWGFTAVFKTSRCCQSLDAVSIYKNNEGFMEIANTDLDQDVNSVILYKKDGDDDYTPVEAGSDTTVLDFLEPCTFYEFYVSAQCINGDVIVSDTFRLLTACPSVCDPAACIPVASATGGHINDFTFNGKVSATGYNYGYLNYGDHLHLEAPDNGPFTNSINIYKAESGIARLKIFIDANKDGIYSAGELFREENIGGSNVHLDFTHDFYGALAEGTYRMRVMLAFTANADPCGGDRGEVEDYCLTIYHVLLNECDPVETITESNKTFTSIDLSWDKPQDDAIAYVYRYKELPGGEYTYVSDTAHKITLRQLKECTTYEFGIFTVCHTDTSGFKTITFATDCSNATRSLDEVIQWKVFPNPFAERVNIILTSYRTGEGRLRLTDAKGNVVYDKSLTLTIGDHYYDLEANAGLAPGLYILTLTDGKGIKSTKLIKQ